jgi:tetratricopeptide (TPR) repeat protein
VPGADPVKLAAEARHLVGVAPTNALRVGAEACRAARAAADVPALSLALGAVGRAYRDLGRLEEAAATLRTAVRVARTGGAGAAEADARIGLAWVLFEQGHTRQALTEADRASSNVAGSPTVRLLGQRALLYERSGRVAEALACYREALPLARRLGDRSDEARLYHNRGLLHAGCGRLAEAEADTARAVRLRTALGQDLDAASSCWNLGDIAVQRGDVPTALALWEASEAIYRKHDAPVPPGFLINRSELLLSVGLVREAQQTARQAVEETRAAGRSIYLAQALLRLAQAALANADTEAAQEAAHRATALFVRQKRPGWAALARYVGLRAEERAGELTPGLRRRALRVAAELASIGWRGQELDARLVAARVALESGQPALARRELAAAARARSTGRLDLRIRAWYAEALRRLADGDRRGAERALQAGMRVLDQHRSMLGATELRVHMASHGRDVAVLGMSLALESGSATKALQWAERWRARALWRPVRPPPDPELAGALAELRRVTSEVETTLLGAAAMPAPPTRASIARLSSHKAALEDRVRRLARKAAGPLTTGQLVPPTVAALSAELGSRVLVEIVQMKDTLHAVTVRDGVARLQELGDVQRVRRGMESLLFALRRLVLGYGSATALGSARTAAERAAARLDAELLGPLAGVLGQRPLVLVPPAELQALPWSVLPSCHQREVTVAPSAAMWLRAAQADTPREGQVLLAAGPGLPAAADEIADLAAAYGQATRLTGPDATVDAVLRGLDGAAVAHIAAHGRVRSDNPLFSALELADGPLTVYDLERLGRAPRLVLLSACQSGVGHVLAGDEMMGLTAALFALGTRTVVATVIPVPDQATRPIMLALHRGLRRGLSPARALAQARQETDPGDLTQFATAAGFVCFGAG